MSPWQISGVVASWSVLSRDIDGVVILLSGLELFWASLQFDFRLVCRILFMVSSTGLFTSHLVSSWNWIMWICETCLWARTHGLSADALELSVHVAHLWTSNNFTALFQICNCNLYCYTLLIVYLNIVSFLSEFFFSLFVSSLSYMLLCFLSNQRQKGRFC